MKSTNSSKCLLIFLGKTLIHFFYHFSPSSCKLTEICNFSLATIDRSIDRYLLYVTQYQRNKSTKFINQEKKVSTLQKWKLTKLFLEESIEVVSLFLVRKKKLKICKQSDRLSNYFVYRLIIFLVHRRWSKSMADLPLNFGSEYRILNNVFLIPAWKINTTQVGGNRILKAQEFKGCEK